MPETRRVLEALGCRDFDVFPMQVDNFADNIARETVILVRNVSDTVARTHGV